MLSVTQPWPNIQESAVYVHQAKWHTFDSVLSLSTTTPSQLYIKKKKKKKKNLWGLMFLTLFFISSTCWANVLGRQVRSLSLVSACSSWREKNPHEKDLSQSDYIFVCLFVTQLLVLIASLFVFCLNVNVVFCLQLFWCSLAWNIFRFEVV